MAKLTALTRKKLPGSVFAINGKKRKYPIHDLAHGRNALARVSQHGTSSEKSKVRAAVRKKFPGIEQSKQEGGRIVGEDTAFRKKITDIEIERAKKSFRLGKKTGAELSAIQSPTLTQRTIYGRKGPTSPLTLAARKEVAKRRRKKFKPELERRFQKGGGIKFIGGAGAVKFVDGKMVNVTLGKKSKKAALTKKLK